VFERESGRRSTRQNFYQCLAAARDYGCVMHTTRMHASLFTFSYFSSFLVCFYNVSLFFSIYCDARMTEPLVRSLGRELVIVR